METETTYGIAFGHKVTTINIFCDDEFGGTLTVYQGDYLYTRPNGIDAVIYPLSIQDALNVIKMYLQNIGILA